MSQIKVPRAFKLRLEYNASSGKNGQSFITDEHATYINYGVHDMTEKQKLDPDFDVVGYWHGIIIGIQGQNCGQEMYQFVIKVPAKYPEQPPIMRFVTKIVLPNNCVDSQGYVNIARIPNFTWNEECNLSDVLVAVREAMKDRASIAASTKLIGQEFFRASTAEFPERDFS